MEHDPRLGIVGIGTALFAAGAIILALIVGGSGDGGSSAGSPGSGGCSLTTRGLGIVASGLTRNESAERIVGEVAGTSAKGEGCEKAIETFVASPDEPVDIEIQSPDGARVAQAPTGADLAQPAPARDAPANLLDCFDHDGGFVIRLCLDGVITPPDG